MKKIKLLLLLATLPAILFSQEYFQRPLFELKITPTSILNLNKPNLLIGAEVYVSPKIGLQLEYGIPLAKNHHQFFISLASTQRREENWLYKRIKGELKYYIFQKKGFSDFISGGILHTPQSYTVTSGIVVLSNGQNISISNARMESYEMAFFMNYGGKIWFSEQFFMEYYMGTGIKQTRNSLVRDIDSPVPSGTILPSANNYSFLDFSNRINAVGEWNNLFVDFGFKFGLSF